MGTEYESRSHWGAFFGSLAAAPGVATGIVRGTREVAVKRQGINDFRQGYEAGLEKFVEPAVMFGDKHSAVLTQGLRRGAQLAGKVLVMAAVGTPSAGVLEGTVGAVSDGVINDYQ